MTEKKTAFNNFNYAHNGELYVFKDYKGLQAFRYTMASKPLKLYWALKDYTQRQKEIRLEVAFKLPKGYLEGLIYKTPRNKKYRDIASIKAQEYFRIKLQNDVRVAVSQLLPQMIEMHTRYSNMHFSFNSLEAALQTDKKLEPSTYDVPKGPPDGDAKAVALPTAPPFEAVAKGRLPVILENEYQNISAD